MVASGIGPGCQALYLIRLMGVKKPGGRSVKMAVCFALNMGRRGAWKMNETKKTLFVKGAIGSVLRRMPGVIRGRWVPQWQMIAAVMDAADQCLCPEVKEVMSRVFLPALRESVRDGIVEVRVDDPDDLKVLATNRVMRFVNNGSMEYNPVCEACLHGNCECCTVNEGVEVFDETVLAQMRASVETFERVLAEQIKATGEVYDIAKRMASVLAKVAGRFPATCPVGCEEGLLIGELHRVLVDAQGMGLLPASDSE